MVALQPIILTVLGPNLKVMEKVVNMTITRLPGITMKFLALLILPLTIYAGTWKPTAHSRANCAGFNESITWHAGHSYWWRVESHHYRTPMALYPDHVINTGKQFTWRAAAYHATEAYASRGDEWRVVGYHFYYPKGPQYREQLDVITTAEDCGLESGWW